VALPHPAGSAPDVVRLTEGPLKADVATVLDPGRVLTVAVAGVDLWRAALPVLAALHPREVRLAFDIDAATNPGVGRALVAACAGMETAGFFVVLERWQTVAGHPKGIDDALLAGVPIEVVR
jgi:hypothetical protein